MFDLFNILIRYAFAFITVCIFCPVIVFSKVGDNKLESFFANFSRIVFTLIIAGYILVFIKLFELIVLISIVAIFAARKVIFIKFYKSDRNIRKELKLWAYDYSDGLIKLSKLLGSRLTLWKNDLKDRFVSFFKNQHYNIISLSLIFIYSGWMRFYDVIINAAPAMSDAYVTLAWIKYINRRILFHDGIYPMGFHIYQAVLHKFSAMDPLFILKITGPLNSILIILGIYFLVSRLLKNIQAGIAAAAIYGVFNVYLANDVERQVATNSQEFAFVFILPCIWFLYKYIVNRDKNDLYAAGAALAVIGLVHTLAIAFVLLITSILILALLVTNARVFRETFLKILLTGATAFFISMVPLGLGLLSGKSFHGTSLDFATAQASYIEYPKLMLPDYMTVASLFLLALNLVTDKDKQTRTARLFILLSGGSIFAIYYYGAVLTGKALIA